MDERPAHAGRFGVLLVRARLLASVAALLALAGVFAGLQLAGSAPKTHAAAPAFLRHALGSPQSHAPLTRKPAQDVRVQVTRDGYRVHRPGLAVGVALRDSGAGAGWTRYDSGVLRETAFGSESIVVGGTRTEDFLTVTRRQGARTWRWSLEARSLKPRSRVDGSIDLLRQDGSVGPRILPLRIADGRGRDVTPDGARWRLERSGGAWTIALRLDDQQLPVPYVIDPAVDYGPTRLYLTNTQSGTFTLGTSGVTPGVTDTLVTTAPSTLCTSGTDCPAMRDTTNNTGTRYIQVVPNTSPTAASYSVTPQLPVAGAAAFGSFIVDNAGHANTTVIPTGSWTFDVYTKNSAQSATAVIHLAMGAWVVT
ncbi:MAG TPA: hypothetical protein VGJ77_05565, partial [Gaiellaceae bacterium]